MLVTSIPGRPGPVGGPPGRSRELDGRDTGSVPEEMASKCCRRDTTRNFSPRFSHGEGWPGSFLSLTPGPLSAETMWTVRAVTLAHAVPYLQEKIVATSACFHPHLFSPRIGGQLRQHLTRYIGKNTPECRKYNGACQHMETNGEKDRFQRFQGISTRTRHYRKTF